MEFETKDGVFIITKEDFYEKLKMWWDIADDWSNRLFILKEMGLIFLCYKYSDDGKLSIKFLIDNYTKFFLAKIKYGI